MNVAGEKIEAAEGPWELPPGWAWASLGELGTWTGGGTPSKANPEFWRCGTIPWVSPKDMKADTISATEDSITEEAVARSATNYVPASSILMVLRSGILRHTFPVAINDRIVTLNQDLRALTPHGGITAAFVARYLKHASRRVLTDCAKDVNSIEFAALEGLPVPIAPTNEQRRIVERIDALFVEIAEGEAALAEARKGLALFRRSLLKAAVIGELTRNWRAANTPAETSAALLNRIVAARARLIDKARRRPKILRAKPPRGLPNLPERWTWASWDQIGSSQNGRPFPSSKYSDNGIRLLRPGNLFSDGAVRWSDRNTRYLPNEFLNGNENLLVKERELIINLTAQSLKDEFLGRVCLTASAEYCLLNQRLARLTPTIIPPEYMLIVFKSALFRSFVEELNSGSLIQHMFTTQVSEFKFPLPPLAEQQEIIQRVSEALAAADDAEKELDAEAADAARLKQSILKAAFEGHLVPQDPNDEPASALLARLRSIGSAKPPQRRRRPALAM